MLGENEDVVPEKPEVTTSSTSSPDEYSWTSPQTIVPEISQNEPTTTLRPITNFPTESSPQTSENPTTLTVNSEEEGNTELPVSTTTIIADSSDNSPSPTTPTTTTTRQKSSSSEEFKSNSGENVIQSFSRENSLRYLVTKSPAFNEYLRNQEKTKENNPNYPKNHRSKWSEVHYPDKSLFGKWNSKNQQSGEVKSSEEVAVNEPSSTTTKSDDGTVTDYVKAIFESIKSADTEDHHQTTTTSTTTTTTPEPTTAQPTKVKTSVSSSSRVVAQKSKDSQETPTSATIESPSPSYGPFVPSIMSDKQTDVTSVKKTPLEMNLRKILRTSTSTKVSQMTEICYRGRCVMSKPKKEGSSRWANNR